MFFVFSIFHIFAHWGIRDLFSCLHIHHLPMEGLCIRVLALLFPPHTCPNAAYSPQGAHGCF